LLLVDVTLGVGKLVESVLEYVRGLGLLKAGDRAGVAVSGGADSVALLRLLLELRQEVGVVLSVVHFNHSLRGTESDTDERFVAQLAEQHRLEFHCGRGDVAKHGATEHLSTEAAARQLRYQYFLRMIAEERLNCVATGHTLDDQAETVLLRIVRGAGTRGLAGIYPKVSYPKRLSSKPTDPALDDSWLEDDRSQFSIVRPLLGTRRADLESYLAAIGQRWCEDSSNRDLRHARNRVRHGIVPRLERTLNPKVTEALAETAEIARSEEEYWQKEVARVLPEVWDSRTGKLTELDRLPLALRRRMVRAAAESLGLRLEFSHVEEILGLAAASSTMLPGGWAVSGIKDKTGVRFTQRTAAGSISDYEYVLTVPGVVRVPEAGSMFKVTMVPRDAMAGYNPDHVFDPALLRTELTVRNWRPGDRFWPAHRKAPKKVKQLLQERKLADGERKLWPVVVSGEEIVWIRGFPAPAQMRPPEGAKQALVIQEYSKA
jgi:tRNA(Ile)-lysidine synthase